MRTFLLLALFAIGGVLMMRTVLGGLACWGLGYWIHEKAKPGDEEAFVAWFMFLAGLGAVAVIVRGVWSRLTVLL